MKDLEEKVIATLEEGPASINELRTKIGCNKNRLTRVWKKLVREGVIEDKKEVTKIILTLKNRARSISEGFIYLKNTKRLIQYHLDCIEDLKRQGKNLEQKNENGTYWLHFEPKKHVDKILELLNTLNDICVSYQYLHVFEYAKDYSRRELNKLQKEVEFFTKSVLRKLKYHASYFYQGYIGSEIFRLHERIKLDQYFKEHDLKIFPRKL